MSVPRVTWTATVGSIFDCMYELQFRTRMITGVFWGQVFERELELALKEDQEKYALMIDYDSIFDARDIVRLWEIMESDKSITSLCPVQVMRECDRHLYRRKMETERKQNGVIDIEHGHFGLTLIRLSHLHGLPRPLFRAIPDPDGGWGPLKVDEDINFWNQLNKYGRRVCMAPDVKIGHLQLMVTWPNGDGASHQYVNDYKAKGRPSNCEVTE